MLNPIAIATSGVYANSIPIAIATMGYVDLISNNQNVINGGSSGVFYDIKEDEELLLLVKAVCFVIKEIYE